MKIRKILNRIFIATILFASSCSSENYNGLDRFLLKGKVKTFEERICNPQKKANSWVPEEYFGNRHLFSFEESGNYISHKEYYKNEQEILKQSENKFKDGKLIEQIYTTKEGILDFTIKYRYHDKNQFSYDIINKKGKKTRTVKSIEKGGKILSNVTIIWEAMSDNEGNDVYEMNSIDYTEFDFDDLGNVMEEAKYDIKNVGFSADTLKPYEGKGELLYKIGFEYLDFDKTGNWTKMIAFKINKEKKDSIPYFMKTRVYSYYEQSDSTNIEKDTKIDNKENDILGKVAENKDFDKVPEKITEFAMRNFSGNYPIFQDKNILSQLWKKDHEKIFRNYDALFLKNENRISNFDEILLYVSRPLTAEENKAEAEAIEFEADYITPHDNSIWYCILDKNKNVIDYFCLARNNMDEGDGSGINLTGKFTAKNQYERLFTESYWAESGIQKREEESLCMLQDDGIVNEITEGVDENDAEAADPDDVFPKTQKRFEVAGIEIDEDVYNFIKKLKSCSNCQELAKYVSFPVTNNGKELSKTKFPEKCDKFMQEIYNLKYDDNMASYRGVMFGSGKLYINLIDNKIQITAINFDL